MRSKDVLVSVVMGVYNGEAYLREAIQSVLEQTYKNFEFIIVDDASTDATVSILNEFQDKRIQVLHNKENKRLAYSLNRGIKVSKGKYILRMDADDICMPDRFEKQVAFMERNPDVGVSFGTIMNFSDGEILNTLDTNEHKAEYIATNMLFFNTVCHPSVIMRREIFDTMEYNEYYTVSEDLELWLRVVKDYKIVRTKDHTLLYRVHRDQVSMMHSAKQITQECEMKRPYLHALMGEVSEKEYAVFSKISRRRETVSQEQLFIWLEKLSGANKKAQIYNDTVFEQVLLRIGMIVAFYNHYFPAFMLEGMCKFGIGAMIKAGFRMTKNFIEEILLRLRIIARAKKVLRKYER